MCRPGAMCQADYRIGMNLRMGEGLMETGEDGK
jgi:hypothetical protein